MNYPKKRIAIAIAMIGCAAQPLIVHAEENASQLERVEVVGSNIKRAATKQATQVEIYKTEEFTKQGLTTTQEIVNALASNQSSTVSSSSVGESNAGAAYANLRGLGEQYTLVLIDGRRASNLPVSGAGSAVDLNGIPLDAIDRVEVLKDGASAIYGTDAIGGVINFITKKSFQGVTVSTDYAMPTHSGGGTQRKASVAGGIGDLNKDGWNVQGSLGASKQTALYAKDRQSIAVDRSPSISANTFPSNYIGSNGNLYNPNYPNCRTGTIPQDSGVGDTYCGENTSNWIGIYPEVERVNISGKASKKLGQDHELSLQYIRAETTTTSTVAPTPLAGKVSISPSSPYYPTTNPDGSANSGSLDLYGRTVPLGPRVNEDTTIMQRLQSNLEGTLAGWDYKAGIGYAQSEVTQSLKSGYISSTKLQNAIDQGLINPFGDSAAGAWKSVEMTGDLSKSTMKLLTGDFKISKEILELPTGNLAVAFGIEGRREKLNDQEFELSRQALSTGHENSQSAGGNRNVHAVYAEAIIPVMNNLETQLAARYDTYSDFGSTFNPKISFKFTPIKQVMFRGSGSTGFRAPTLYNLYQPKQTTNTQSKYSDPFLCPNGVLVPGAPSSACVKKQVDIQSGGTTDLKPETSSSVSFGLVVEPVPSVTLSADMWWTRIKNQIGSLPESTIMGNLGKYGSRLVAKADGSLDYIQALDQNLGNVNAAGTDLFAMWRLPRTSFGNFNVSVNSTYMSKYLYQNEIGGEYINNISRYADNGPVFRWKTELNLGWNYGAWSSTIGQSYVSGYDDMYTNDDGSVHHINGYGLWNASVSYDWRKTLNVTLGMRNMFDKKPPYSNQDQRFQTGYDPRYTDILGRTVFLNLTYKM